jgi:hypothetical protein
MLLPIGGGVDNGRLEGVLPAAAFFSTWMHHKHISYISVKVPKDSNPSKEEITNLSKPISDVRSKCFTCILKLSKYINLRKTFS